MEIDDAIELLREDECLRISEEDQISKWLEDYKRLLIFEKGVLSGSSGFIPKMYALKGYIKALEDFTKEVSGNIMFSTFGIRAEDAKKTVEILKRNALQQVDSSISSEILNAHQDSKEGEMS